MEIKTKYPVIYLNTEEILLPLNELADRAKEVVLKTGSEKVNIVAWSRWGLAARMLACEMPEKIASVTTVCTPHRGLRTVEKRFGRPAVKCWGKLAADAAGDIGSAVLELAPENMREFNEKFPDAEGVFYQSCACAMKSSAEDKRLAAANNIVSIYDGENDGVVSVYSALWGQHGIVCRGVSHLNVSEEIYERLTGILAEQGL
ncbi:MAG: hypothetical protein Q4A83_03005 [Bacillota bacterium]|nr:hypothetical protein [Bacillota bacterium]